MHANSTINTNMKKIQQDGRLMLAIRLSLAALFVFQVFASAGWSQDAAKEPGLIAILKSSASPGEKAVACKNLAVFGSAEAVPELAKLLTDEQLASWSRIALEAIPGAAANEALRKALDSVQGKLLVGVINSIGVRRDSDAVSALITRLQHSDSEVASSSAVALGKIGNSEATAALRRSLTAANTKVRSAVAEGCILCAERLNAEGNSAEAIKIYDEVRKADLPRQRILEATRGAIVARKKDGIPLLVEQLRSSDKALFQIGLSTARELGGREVDAALAAELVSAAPERAPLLIHAMADRKDTVVLSALLNAAERGAKPARLAAASALGRVGDVSCLAPLLEMALEADPELAQAAKSAAATLPAGKVDESLVALLNKAEGKTYPIIIELVGQRRIEAVTALIKAAEHSDKGVRSAALVALGETVPAKQLPVLISHAVSPKRAEDAAIAQQALKAACVRMPDREACADQLVAALDRAPVATKTVLLDVLGAVGGTKSLQALATAAKSTDPQLQDISSRLLGEWMTIDAAPVLLDLTKSAPGEKYQVRALRGYIRIARQFIMPENQRAEMCNLAFAASKQSAEQKLVLDITKRYPSIDMLKLAIRVEREVPELKEEASQAKLMIAQKLAGKSDEVAKLLASSGLERVKVEIVKAEYGAGSTQKDVTDIVRKHVSDLPIVALPNAGFNAAFGGDPIPNAVKQLKIQYRMNGKAGEATFAENAIVILPMPK